MDQSITKLSGVGSKVESLLKRLSIETVGDLVRHTPRRYEDYSQLSKLESIKPGPVSAEVKITSVTGRYVRKGLHITEAVFEDDTDSVKAVWFNQPYRKNHLKIGKSYFMSGKYEFSNRRYVILNPSVEAVSDFPAHTARILPIYKETKGLTSHTLRKLLQQIDFSTLDFDEPPFTLDISTKDAYKLIHFPQSAEDIKVTHDYFAFQELFSLMLSARLARAQTDTFKAHPIPIAETKLKAFTKSLPFVLTDDQRKAAWKSLTDMSQGKPMNRLIEGDVGSGKTVVASMLAYATALASKQTAIMVPTGVLAQQHAEHFYELLNPLGITTALFTGSLKKTEKDALKKQLKSGEIDVVIGTHALIQEGVEYKSLNLVIVDEQHRFGVKQRNSLVGKSDFMPHVLTMTATPIPRSLALTVFGDLDISIIAQMPAGRKPVKTKVVSPNSMQTVHNLVLREVKNGRQAFIIYPLVEESENLSVGDAVSAYEKFSKTVYKDLRVGLIHGRLKAEEKDSVMRDFADRRLDVLISTTVIEVGVNVPNATVMVVEGAERFGLAQIHQLRGRVGRGEHQAYCVLVPSTSKNVSQRLRALETLTSGFELAEYDLELRGPGTIYGSSQSGALDLRYTKLNDAKMIARARDAVSEFIQSGQKLVKYPSLKREVDRFKSITRLN